MLLLTLSSAASAADYQHALIIVVDDLGTDKVGAYAGDVDNPSETRPSTPAIDLLADAGVRFSDAWATPSCSPTRATHYTGEHPHRAGIGGIIRDGSDTRLATSPLTLPQLAADAGLSTALFGKWHLGTTSDTPTSATAPFDHAEYMIEAGFGWYQGGCRRPAIPTGCT